MEDYTFNTTITQADGTVQRFKARIVGAKSQYEAAAKVGRYIRDNYPGATQVVVFDEPKSVVRAITKQLTKPCQTIIFGQ
jgi:hypothetical protein